MEVWKDVKGFEGIYQVSNYGNIRGLEREVRQGKYGNTRTIPGTNINSTDNGNGYRIIFLWKQGKRKRFYVHRLVAEHFVENGGGYAVVNHKDCDTTNNHADNLEWCSQKDNIRHSVSRMRKPHKQWKQSGTGEKHIYLKNNRYRVSIKGKIDKTFKTLEEALRAREVVLSGEKYLAG